MDLLGIVYGIATFYGLKGLQKPLKRAAVVATSHAFEMMDRSREVAYNLKEGFEDIIAEAQYENLVRRQGLAEVEVVADEEEEITH